MEIDAIEPDEPLGANNEAEWDRLRSQLVLADGFWLGFIFSPSPRSTAVLRERTERLLRAQTRTLVSIQPATPDELVGVLATLTGDDALLLAGSVWVDAVHSDSPGAKEQPWTSAWDELFLRTNVRRDLLRKRLPGGLVFAAPPEIKPRVREAAPDLWSVRSIVVDLAAARRSSAVEPFADPFEATASESTSLPPDVTFALAEADRRKAHGDAASQARALLQATEGLLAAGRAIEARQSAREAWRNLLELGPKMDAYEAADALAILARTERLYGDPAASAEHIQEAIERRRAMDPERIPLEWYYLAGGLARERSDLTMARALYEEAEAAARARSKKHAGVASLRDWSIALGKLGRVQREMGDLISAASSFEQSLGLARQVNELEHDESRSLRDLSLALTNLAKIRRETGDLAAAAAAVEESVALCRRLHEPNGDGAQSLRDLFMALTNAGTIWREAGDTARATSAFEESFAHHAELRELHGDAPDALRELAVVQNSVGRMRREAGDLKNAAEAFTESLALRRRLRELHGDTPQVLRDVAAALNNLGTVRREADDVAAAEAAFSEAVGILRRLEELRHDAPRARRDLSITLSNLAKVKRLAGDVATADAFLEEARTLRDYPREPEARAGERPQPTSAPASTDEHTAPARIHITTGLQAVRLPDLVKLDQVCSAMYRGVGIDASAVPARSEVDFVGLARRNSVRVAEIDHVVVGFLAWHDQSPGVAYLTELQVHADYLRFGIAAQLLDAMKDEARGLELRHIVVRCWEKATWAMGFYRRQRFIPIDAAAPDKVKSWSEERLATGKPLTRPGEVALWSWIGGAPKNILDDEMDATLQEGGVFGDD